jgi:hypothetical protein
VAPTHGNVPIQLDLWRNEVIFMEKDKQHYTDILNTINRNNRVSIYGGGDSFLRMVTQDVRQRELYERGYGYYKRVLNCLGTHHEFFRSAIPPI